MARRRKDLEYSFGTSFLDLCSCALGGLILLMILLVPQPRGEGQLPDMPIERFVTLTVRVPYQAAEHTDHNSLKIVVYAKCKATVRLNDRDAAVFEIDPARAAPAVRDADLEVNTQVLQRSKLPVLELTVSAYFDPEAQPPSIEVVLEGQSHPVHQAEVVKKIWAEATGTHPPADPTWQLHDEDALFAKAQVMPEGVGQSAAYGYWMRSYNTLRGYDIADLFAYSLTKRLADQDAAYRLTKKHIGDLFSTLSSAAPVQGHFWGNLYYRTVTFSTKADPSKRKPISIKTTAKATYTINQDEPDESKAFKTQLDYKVELDV